MKIVTVVGARPQFIKAAPLSRTLKQAGIEEVLVDTGQHYDEEMAGAFFKELSLPAPAYSLQVGSASHGKMTGRMLEKIEQVLLDEKPDGLVVYGDTNSTLAGSLAAAKLHIPIFHIEAGLRSYRKGMPEEINRCMTDHVSSLLLCPTAVAIENLAKEGIQTPGVSSDPLSIAEISAMDMSDDAVVLNVGDIMVDAIHWVKERVADQVVLEEFEGSDFALVTMHRAESTDDEEIFTGLMKQIAAVGQEMRVVFPLHPRTKYRLEQLDLFTLFEDSQVQFLPPLTYAQFAKGQMSAKVVITDSGGVQKESCILGTPCLTLREETEWVETVATGWNKLLGLTPQSLVDEIKNIERPSEPGNLLYGDGQAAQRIVASLQAYLK